MRTFGKRLRGRSIFYFLLFIIFLGVVPYFELDVLDLINLLLLYQCLPWRIEFFMQQTISMEFCTVARYFSFTVKSEKSKYIHF